MKKAIPHIYLIIFIIGFLYMLSGMLFGNNQLWSRIGVAQKVQIYPDQMQQLDEDTFRFDFFLDRMDFEGFSPCLEVFTVHQSVKAFADEKLVYSMQPPERSVFGKTAGSAYHFIEIPAETKTFYIEFSAAYPQSRTEDYEFYLGDGISIYREYIGNSLLVSIISILTVIFGFAMVCYWLIFWKKAKQGPEMMYFGLFTVLLGLWTLTETDLFKIMTPQRGSASTASFALLMLMAPPFVLFIKHFLEVEDEVICNLICTATYLNFVVCSILHITGICYYKQTIILTHIIMAVAFCYMAGCMIQRVQKRGFDHLVKINLIAILVLLAAFGTSLIGFYRGARRIDIIGRIGLLVYIYLVGRESISDFLRQVEEGRKAELYKELAITDVMTGLYNRSAFEEWVEKNPDCSDIMLLTFDLNNLKACNDNLGHAIGDKYIIDAAKIIRQIFGNIGVSYRIGGDEFCTIVRNSSKVKVENYLARLERLQEEYNSKSADVVMKIAYGYAVYEDTDKSVEDTRDRADVLMYQKKKAMKHQGAK